MILKVVSLLTGLLGGSVGDKILEAQKQYLEAENDREKLLAEQRLQHLQSQEKILLAEQGHWMTRWIRPAFALPFVVYLNKVVIYDKVLGWGATDPLSPELGELMLICFGAYFLMRPVEKGISKFLNRG